MGESVSASSQPQRTRRRFLKAKTILGLLLLAVSFFHVGRHVVNEITSSAVVTAEIDRIVAPMQGFVTHIARSGEMVPVDSPLVTLEAYVVDEQERLRLERELGVLETGVWLAERELAELAETERRWVERENAWREALGRLLQAEERELSAMISAREALLEQRRAERHWAEDMASRSLWAEPRVAAARASERALEMEIAALAARRDRLRIEREVAENGQRLREGSIDAPSAALFREQLALRRSDTVRRLEEAKAQAWVVRVAGLYALEAAERRRFWEARRERDSYVWQRHVVPGSLVQPGMTLLDAVSCRDVFVLAALPERLYDSLATGSLVWVVLRDGRRFEAKLVRKYGYGSLMAEEGVLAAKLVRPFGSSLTVRLEPTLEGREVLTRGGEEPCPLGRQADVVVPRRVMVGSVWSAIDDWASVALTAVRSLLTPP